jgi:hypothetical protein
MAVESLNNERNWCIHDHIVDCREVAVPDICCIPEPCHKPVVEVCASQGRLNALQKEDKAGWSQIFQFDECR